jgi:hypothetical protein
MKPAQRSPPPVTMWIMVAVLVWGGYLALGALRAGGNHAAWRGLIVFACTLAFLGLWWAALRFRASHAEDETKT